MSLVKNTCFKSLHYLRPLVVSVKTIPMGLSPNPIVTKSLVLVGTVSSKVGTLKRSAALSKNLIYTL